MNFLSIVTHNVLIHYLKTLKQVFIPENILNLVKRKKYVSLVNFTLLSVTSASVRDE